MPSTTQLDYGKSIEEILVTIRREMFNARVTFILSFLITLLGLFGIVALAIWGPADLTQAQGALLTVSLITWLFGMAATLAILATQGVK